MFLVEVRMVPKLDCTTRVVALMNGLSEIGRGETGCVVYEFFCSTSSDNIYLLFEKWVDQESHDAHFASEAVRELLPDLLPLLAEPLDISYFNADPVATPEL